MQHSIRRYVILAVVFVACMMVYSARSQTLQTPQESEPTISNAVILKDWAPADVYNATLQRIRYYLAIYNIPGTTLTITGTPSYGDDGSLSFNFQTDTANQDSTLYGVTVQTTDYGGGVTSSAITINGKLVTYAAADSLYGAQFSNFDSLTNYGLTGQQVYEIQQALNRFVPNGTFDITTSSISQQFSDSVTKTSFTVSIDGKKYQLVSASSDINGVQFVLLDGKNKSVFDSGLMSFSN